MKILKQTFGMLMLVLTIVFSGVFTSCSDDEDLSDLTGFLTFGFSDEALNGYEFEIGEDGIITNSIALPYGFDASSLTPVFTTAPLAVAYIGELEQTSGTQAMDFSADVMYKVVAEDGSTTKAYTVRVNVATDLSAWTNLAPNANFPDFTSVVGYKINDKYFIMGGKKGASGIGGHSYGIYSSTDGTSFSEVNTNIFKEYGMGLGAAALKHGNKQLLIGGYTPSDYEVWGETGNGSAVNIVWSSEDGETWTKVNESATAEQKFSARTNATVANMNGDLYLTGGYSVGFGAPQGALKDVWKSTDGGATWTDLSAQFGDDFVARAESQLLVYNNELYLMGGRTKFPYTYFNEIYKSADGVSWTKVEVATPFTARSGFSSFVYNDRMYVLAGISNETVTEDGNESTVDLYLNDVWVSEDGGVNWTEMTSGALPSGFAARYGQATVIENNTVHIFGGNSMNSDDEKVVLTDAWKGILN